MLEPEMHQYRRALGQRKALRRDERRNLPQRTHAAQLIYR